VAAPGGRQHTQHIGDHAQVGVAVAGNVYGPVSVNTGPVIPSVPRMAPPPTHFIPRPAEYEQLIDLLTTATRRNHVAICAALRGAGGYGKTTLAQAVCQDDRIRAAYRGGTLWVTVGEQPQSIADLIADLIAAITGVRPALRTDDEAATALDTALGDRACLLVIDDVWSDVHLGPFIHGAPNCTRLITTRIAETLPAHTAVLPLTAMHPNEAVDVLQDRLPITPSIHPRNAALAERLGKWPLLLGLANGALREQIERGDTVHAALAQVEQALDTHGLTAFDPTNPEQRRHAVAGTIAVSLDRLPTSLRLRHAELAIFPGDIPIPLDMIAMLWQSTGGLVSGEAEEVCLRLASRSLIQTYDAHARTLTLHDEVRSYLTAQHQAALPGWHTALLAGARPQSAVITASPASADTRSLWADLPANAPYLWEYLGYHLVQAGQGDAFVAAVLDMRYLLQKMSIRDIFAAEADIRRVIQVAPALPALVALERVIRLRNNILAACTDSANRAATLLAYAWHEAALQPYVAGLYSYIRYPIFLPLTSLTSADNPALLRTLAAHTDWVFSMALSADGHHALWGGDDGTLRLWDLERDPEQRALEGHTGAVKGVVLSADGRHALSGGDDGTLRLWDLASGQELRTLEGRTSVVRSVALSTDGQQALSGGDDGTLRLWDLASGQELRTLAGHTRGVNSVALSADGQQALSGGDDGTLRLWDLASGQKLRTLAGHTL
jgi:WD40 repeat protein